MCPNCQQSALPSLGTGVNPRGLASCEVWQTDVTHIPEFGRLKYVHISIGTFFGAVYASAYAGETAIHTKKHQLQAFAVLGVPKEIKTDKGPAYRAREFESFMDEWGIRHKKGIPYSPTGQAVIEHAHQMLKSTLRHQWADSRESSPQDHLCKALFTINFLNCSFDNLNPPVIRHFGPQSNHPL